jgi:hypothetical protein
MQGRGKAQLISNTKLAKILQFRVPVVVPAVLNTVYCKKSVPTFYIYHILNNWYLEYSTKNIFVYYVFSCFFSWIYS